MMMAKMLDIQRALADETRVLVTRLLLERELCVCELVAALDIPQYKASRHLAVLRDAGLVRGRRDGAWMHYEISPDLSPEWRRALHALGEAWDAGAEVQQALTALASCCGRAPGAPQETRTAIGDGTGTGSRRASCPAGECENRSREVARDPRGEEAR